MVRLLEFALKVMAAWQIPTGKQPHYVALHSNQLEPLFLTPVDACDTGMIRVVFEETNWYHYEASMADY